MRTQSIDTSPAFERIQIARIRAFSAAKKFQPERKGKGMSSLPPMNTPEILQALIPLIAVFERFGISLGVVKAREKGKIGW